MFIVFINLNSLRVGEFFAQMSIKVRIINYSRHSTLSQSCVGSFGSFKYHCLFCFIRWYISVLICSALIWLLDNIAS